MNLQNQVSVDFQCEDMLEIELILQLLPWRKGPFKLNDINIDSEWDSSKKWIRFKELDWTCRKKQYSMLVLAMGITPLE